METKIEMILAILADQQTAISDQQAKISNLEVRRFMEHCNFILFALTIFLVHRKLFNDKNWRLLNWNASSMNHPSQTAQRDPLKNKVKQHFIAAVKSYVQLIRKVRLEVTGSILTEYQLEIHPSSYNATWQQVPVNLFISIFFTNFFLEQDPLWFHTTAKSRSKRTVALILAATRGPSPTTPPCGKWWH